MRARARACITRRSLGCVPGGTRRLTSPSSVGTRTCETAPRSRRDRAEIARADRVSHRRAEHRLGEREPDEHVQVEPVALKRAVRPDADGYVQVARLPLAATRRLALIIEPQVHPGVDAGGDVDLDRLLAALGRVPLYRLLASVRRLEQI